MHIITRNVLTTTKKKTVHLLGNRAAVGDIYDIETQVYYWIC